MTATNHALTGAVIALTVRWPFVAIPVAFLSHFVLDSIPHFGTPGDVLEFAKNRLQKTVTIVDVRLIVFLLVFVPWFYSEAVSALLIFACMVTAYAPDFGWVYRFLRNLKRAAAPINAISRFHLWIQWKEVPRALMLFVEGLWAVAMTASLVLAT